MLHWPLTILLPKALGQPNASVRSRVHVKHRNRRFHLAQCWLVASLLGTLAVQGVIPAGLSPALAQSGGGAIQMKASRVEANSNTGVVTATGNVRIDYPSRQIYATSAQAQYFSREQRIVLSGNVDIIQEGNRLQAETVTYLIEEGRFVATPAADQQVEAVYILPEEPAAEPSLENPQPEPLSIPTPPAELPAELGPIPAN